MEKLHDKTCAPCEGREDPLTREQIKPYLAQLNGWMVVDDKKIERGFVFTNFARALEFVNAVGDIAESERHHPDILLYDYKKVKISLWTHVIGGLSENDFIVASKIDGIAAEK